MDQLERRLRASLAAREPPADFTDAVMARVRQAEAARTTATRSARTTWRFAGAIAATVLATAVGLHWHAERQQAAQSRDQLLLALAITSNKLGQVQQKLLRDPSVQTEQIEQENGS